jgi:UDP-glucose 4-epimerase
MNVLITGGSGYIGSHIALILLNADYSVIVLDNFSNSSYESLSRVQQLTEKSIIFVQGDIQDRSVLDKLFSMHTVHAVVHLAGLKSVGQSVTQPLVYYDNNIVGTITLCQAMIAAEVFNLVFSSSATVYGYVEQMPIKEDCPVGTGITNPYGRSKWMIEQILTDLAISDPRWHIALLRYFNPVGAHESGRIGEDPLGTPTNLMPLIAQVAIGRLDYLQVFGNDYDTPDGTGVRDYIHVMDLAEGHYAALQKLSNFPGCHAWNLGTGRGYSVLEMLRAFESISGKEIPHKMAPRRIGDVPTCWADVSKANSDLKWSARRNMTDMIRDTWNWQVQNPQGYKSFL